MKRLLPLLVVVALGGAAYYYFNRPPDALTLTGIVTTNDVIVGPQIGGRIDELHVAEGDTVKQQQMNEQVRQAESNLAATEAQQAAAVADLEAARLILERTQSLAREGVAPAQQLDSARTGYDAAQARVEALKRQGDAVRATIAL